MTKRKKPPSAWMHLFSGDMIHTTIPRHKIDTYLEVMSEQGYTIELEPTVKGYMLHCRKSPHDLPNPKKINPVK